jgi:hypothetical protein
LDLQGDDTDDRVKREMKKQRAGEKEEVAQSERKGSETKPRSRLILPYNIDINTGVANN